MKICILCKEEKELELFYKSKNKDGRQSSCKECSKIKYKYDKTKRSEHYHNVKERDKEKFKERRKKHYINNKEKENLQSKEYKSKNIDDVNKKAMEYYHSIKGIEEFKEKRRVYKKERYDNDLLYKLYITTGTLIRNSFKTGGFSKKSKTHEILGCSFEEFQIFLENKFENWMNWENRGLYNGELNYGWDVDHIIPLASAETEEDIIRLNHYTNLQPLCSYVNRVIKRDMLTK